MGKPDGRGPSSSMVAGLLVLWVFGSPDVALAQAAETLHRLGYRGLRAKGLKGRHIEALVAEWHRQGLSDGTIKNRMAHLRWLAKKIGKPGIVRRDNASYGVGARRAP